MLKKNLRRSARVFLNLRLHLSVPMERGEEFLGEGKTMDVSQDGASIVVDRDLGVGQTIKIRRVGASKEALARVVGCYQDHRSTGRVFGVALSDKESNLWDIVFPPAAGLEDAVLRSLLRCVACGRLEVSYLNEFESGFFLNHHSVARLCGHCGGWTTGLLLMEALPQVPTPPFLAVGRNSTLKMLSSRTCITAPINAFARKRWVAFEISLLETRSW